MLNLIAISYKENHTDYCRGCVMDRYNSEFEINSGPEDEVIAKKIARLDVNLDPLDTNYDHYFIIEGFVVGPGGLIPPYSADEEPEVYERRDRVQAEYDRLRIEYQNIVLTAKQQKKDEADRRKSIAAKQNAEAERNRELARLKS